MGFFGRALSLATTGCVFHTQEERGMQSGVLLATGNLHFSDSLMHQGLQLGLVPIPCGLSSLLSEVRTAPGGSSGAQGGPCGDAPLTISSGEELVAVPVCRTRFSWGMLWSSGEEPNGGNSKT